MTDVEEPPEPDIPPEYQADVELEDDWEEQDPPDWITNVDREILALLGNSVLIMTPSIIAKNIDRSRSSVSRRLGTLEAGGMVEKVDRGHYQITKKGLSKMQEKVLVNSPVQDDDRELVRYMILTPEELEEIEETGMLDDAW